MPWPIPDVPPTKIATGVYDGEKEALEVRMAEIEGILMRRKKDSTKEIATKPIAFLKTTISFDLRFRSLISPGKIRA
jgi:hypothetical protein